MLSKIGLSVFQGSELRFEIKPRNGWLSVDKYNALKYKAKEWLSHQNIWKQDKQEICRVLWKL